MRHLLNDILKEFFFIKSNLYMIASANYIAIIVAAIAAMVVGSLWYSPIMFMKKWVAYTGMTPGVKTHNLSPMEAMAGEAVLALLTAFVLGHFATVLGTHTTTSALKLGIWVWLGFQMPVLLSGSLFEKRPWGLFFINASMRLVGVCVMALIVGLWV